MKQSLYNREDRINFIYNVLITNMSEEQYSVELKTEFVDAEANTIKTILENLNLLVSELKPNLPNDWKWERMNFLERAILINGLAEIKLFKNSKSIVIDESIEYAKKFNDLKTPPLINAILDNY